MTLDAVPGRCATCLFAGMEPERPYETSGRWRNTCAVWERRQRGGCAVWKVDRGEQPPTPGEVREARDRARQ